MIYLNNNTDTQVIYIPRKAQEPEYMPINKPIEINIDTVKVQDNLMTYSRTVKPENKREGYSTITVSVEVPMSEEKLTDNGLFSFNMPVGTVEVDTSTYGEQRYDEGYNAGHTEGYDKGYQDGQDAGGSGVMPNIDFDYIEPEEIVDIVINQGITGTFVIKGQITEVQSIDLNYGNATYYLGDLKVFRGTGLNHNSIMEEDYFQVGDWVVIVGNVSNYNGTVQIDRGSTLVAKWRGYIDAPVFESNKWGIVGYYNDWGNKPDTYFNEVDFQLLGQNVLAVYGFESDGREIKVRWNNAWDNSYTADLYNEPQIMALERGDWNMDLSEGTWDIYLLYPRGAGYLENVLKQILIVEAGTDVQSLNLTPTLTVDTGGKFMEIEFVNDYDGSGQIITTDTQATFTTYYGNTGFVVGYIDGEEVNVIDFISTGEDIYIQF